VLGSFGLWCANAPLHPYGYAAPSLNLYNFQTDMFRQERRGAMQEGA